MNRTVDILRADPKNAAAPIRFATGIRHLLWGLKMTLTKPSLMMISAGVVALNFVVYLGIFYIGFASRHWLSGLITERLPNFMQGSWTEPIFAGLILIAWALISVFIAIAIASILAGPLLDMLSERTEKFLTGDVNPLPFSIGAIIEEIIVTISLMLKSTLLGLAAMIFVGWIPVVGQVIPFLIAAAFVALNFFTPTVARHKLKSKERTQMLLDNKALVLGFGAPASVFPFLLVPLLTPALVVGGTRLYLSLAASNRAQNSATDVQLATLLGNPQAGESAAGVHA